MEKAIVHAYKLLQSVVEPEGATRVGRRKSVRGGKETVHLRIGAEIAAEIRKEAAARGVTLSTIVDERLAAGK